MASSEIPVLPEITVDAPSEEAENDSNVIPQQSRRVQQSFCLSTSPDKGGLSSEAELTSSFSSGSTISGMSAIESVVASQSCQVRCDLRRELSDASRANPMWRRNRISGISEDFQILDTSEVEVTVDPAKDSKSTSPQEQEQISPSYSTGNPDKPVLLRRWFGATSTPETVPAMLKKMMERNRDKIALALPIVNNQPKVKNLRSWTYAQYYEDCITAAKGFLKYGLEAHHSVCILADPSPNWHIANIAAIMAGGMSVGIDQRSSPETCLKIVNHCSADIIVVDKPHQLEKILKVVSQMECLKTMIYLSGNVAQEPSGVTCLYWEQLMVIGRSTEAQQLQSQMSQLNPANCCSVICTTDCDTDELQGVMLSHDNITWSCKRFVEAAHYRVRKERVLSHMSLADINYQMIDIYAMIASGGCCYFVPFQETVMDTLANVHPTVYLGGSKQWERLQSLMQRHVRVKEIEWKQLIREHLEGNLSLLKKIKSRFNSNTLDECVEKTFRREIRAAVGLEKCRLPLSIATDPVSKSVSAGFQSMGLSLWEQYGAPETTGPVVIANSIDECNVSSGKCYRGTKVKFEAEELLVNSRQVFMGYLHDGPATADVVTDSYWFKTGACGHKEGLIDSTVFITGLVKDMITLSSDEKVAPLPLENAVLKELPMASEAVVIGEGREYLTCLITLEVNIEHECELGLVRYLDPIVKTTLAKHHCRATTLDDFDNDRKAAVVNQLMKEALQKIKKDKSNLIRRIALLRPLAKKPIPLLEPSKKREYILEHYGSLIEELYQQPLVEKIVASVLRSP